MSALIVGVDASPSSNRAIEFASRAAAEVGGTVTLVHVIPWSPYSFSTAEENEHRTSSRSAEVAAAREQIVGPAVDIARKLGIEADTVIVHGNEVEVLVTLAQERSASQIVVGRTGDSGFKQVVFGSTPSRLIQHASIPVTVIP